MKFDFAKFNQPYFDRLRDRVQKLNAAGIYAGVYLFTGEWILRFRSVTDGYPFTGANNINGIDDGGNLSLTSTTMTAPNAITAIQDAYVKKVIDTIHDLPNILWWTSEEAAPNTVWWNQHIVDLVHSYEAGKLLQHPVGWAIMADGSAVSETSILNSAAEAIAPVERISPFTSCGTSGSPLCKVNINDSDHSYYGIWNDTAQVNRNYFWENFTQGIGGVTFMDPYLVDFATIRNHPKGVVNGIGAGVDPYWEGVRNTMGYIRDYADRMNLIAMAPHPEMGGTGHILASATEMLFYQSNTGPFWGQPPSGVWSVEWLNPVTGVKTAGTAVRGGMAQTFTPRFGGDAVLYLKLIAPVGDAGSQAVFSQSDGRP